MPSGEIHRELSQSDAYSNNQSIESLVIDNLDQDIDDRTPRQTFDHSQNPKLIDPPELIKKLNSHVSIEELIEDLPTAYQSDRQDSPPDTAVASNPILTKEQKMSTGSLENEHKTSRSQLGSAGNRKVREASISKSASFKSSKKGIPQIEKDEEEVSSRKSEAKPKQTTPKSKHEGVKFSEAVLSIHSSDDDDDENEDDEQEPYENRKSPDGNQKQSNSNPNLHTWPSQESTNRTPQPEKARQKVRVVPQNESDEEFESAKKTSRARGKSEAAASKGINRQQTGYRRINIDALDLEESNKNKKSSEVSSELYDNRDDTRSPPQQKSKKPRHRGKVNPESDEQENEGYNSDGATKPAYQKPYKKTSSPPMVNPPLSTSAAQPVIQMPSQYQPMMMYGFRPPESFQFAHQGFHPNMNMMQPDYMIQPTVWNPPPPNSQWTMVRPPQNYGYQYYTSAAQEVPEQAKQTSPPSERADNGNVTLPPRPPSSSPPAKAKSPRKTEMVPLDQNADEIDPIAAILAELPQPILQAAIVSVEAEKSVDLKLAEVSIKDKEVNPIAAISAPPSGNLLSNISPGSIQNISTATPSAVVSNTVQPVAAALPDETQVVAPVPAPIIPQDIPSSNIRSNIISQPIQYVVSQEVESQRLAALHALNLLSNDEHPRLTKITQMTARLLGRSCCVLSLVDSDKVIWKSVSPPVTSVKEEPRYDSFCSWVVQDESGRGVTVLDAKSDPRCTHIRVKPGLEFYAGVPITVGIEKHKIGALSIQGPPSSQISVIDMNILHEMSAWASGEIDTILQQKLLQDKESFVQSMDRLSEIAAGARNNFEKTGTDSRSLEKSLSLIRTALKANCVLLFKLNSDQKGFQSTLHGYSLEPGASKTTNLLVGEEMFHELCGMTLKKEGGENALLLDNLKSGAVTKDVDHYLSKKIKKCMSELLWSSSGPTAVISVFFDDNYRIISKEEFAYMRSIIPMLSTIFDSTELKDAFQQASSLGKNIGAALKKYAVPFGKQQGLAPCALIIEPKIDSFKGYEKLDSAVNLSMMLNRPSSVKLDTSEIPSSGAKGQAIGQVIALKQDQAITMSPDDAEMRPLQDPTPLEAFEISNDLQQMLDNLAEKCNIKKPKRIGLQYIVFGNYGPETGSYANLASFAHDLHFVLDTYNQTKRRRLKLQIGIHTDFVPVEAAAEASSLKDHITSLVNGAYQMGVKSDAVFTSDLFYHQTKHFCTYESNSAPVVIKGQGAFPTYRLIGIATGDTIVQPTPHKENGVNDTRSMILSLVPTSPIPDTQKQENVTIPTSNPTQQQPQPKKKNRCFIM